MLREKKHAYVRVSISYITDGGFYDCYPTQKYGLVVIFFP